MSKDSEEKERIIKLRVNEISLVDFPAIEEEFLISYHPGHVRKILYSLNYSMQRPKRVLANADPEKQNKWQRYTYPNIKKKPKHLDQR